MNKKTMAYILIGALVVGILYWIYTKAKASAAASALGAGMPDNRGTWAAADDALYAKLRGMFTANELNWIDPLVEEAYSNSSYSGVSCGNDVKIKGVLPKSGALACVIYGVGPNVDGTHPPVHWAPNMPSLWPKSTYDTIFNELNKLRAKYNGL